MTPYPLAWPPHIPRWKGSREAGRFQTTLSGAMKNVEDSLRRFANDSGKAIKNLTISSNVTLGQSRPSDPGVAIWFEWDGLSVCIPVDRYSKVEANLQAIHHVIEARRVELRHGTLSLVRATFQGFQALPSPAVATWWEILGVAEDAPEKDIRAAYRRKAMELHQTGAGEAAMTELNIARDRGLAK